MMSDKELEDMNLYDIHAKILLLQSGILSFEDWRKDMVQWAHWYLAQNKARPVIDRAKSTEEKAS